MHKLTAKIRSPEIQTYFAKLERDQKEIPEQVTHSRTNVGISLKLDHRKFKTHSMIDDLHKELLDTCQ